MNATFISHGLGESRFTPTGILSAVLIRPVPSVPVPTWTVENGEIPFDRIPIEVLELALDAYGKALVTLMVIAPDAPGMNALVALVVALIFALAAQPR